MSDILTRNCFDTKDFKHISACLDLNMVGKFIYLPRLMRMEIFDKNGVTLINTGIPSDMFNIACITKSKIDIAHVLDEFLSRELPFAWWVGFDEDHHDCKKDIEKSGIKYNETESGMVTVIEDIPMGRRCDALEISQASNKVVLQDFIKVYQELIPHDADSIEKF